MPDAQRPGAGPAWCFPIPARSVYVGRRSNSQAPELLDPALTSLFTPPIVLTGDRLASPPPPGPGARLILGIDSGSNLPDVDARAFDILLTRTTGAPAPWVSSADPEADAAEVLDAAAANPAATAVLLQVLRIGEGMPVEAALHLESLAYSTLLGGEAFRRWRAGVPNRGRRGGAEPVRLERQGDALHIVLDDPSNRNAISAALRDGLVDALTLPLLDPDLSLVELTGAGPVFCSGGHLDEFGLAQDLAAAHLIRVRQSPARLVHRLGERLTARVHGAAIGGGLEIAAAAARLEARPGTRFRLPEIRMGLIPGAGGTMSLPRRIGRHRTAFMALTGRALDTETALAWGLIDGLWGPP